MILCSVNFTASRPFTLLPLEELSLYRCDESNRDSLARPVPDSGPFFSSSSFPHLKALHGGKADFEQFTLPDNFPVVVAASYAHLPRDEDPSIFLGATPIDALLVLAFREWLYEERAVHPWLSLARHIRFAWLPFQGDRNPVLPPDSWVVPVVCAVFVHSSGSSSRATSLIFDTFIDACKDRDVEVVFEDLNEDSDSLISRVYWRRMVKEFKDDEEREKTA
ncbi:hypothetical protein JCM8547_005350 [Rhodosporidiobolus lusitaniae]